MTAITFDQPKVKRTLPRVITQNAMLITIYGVLIVMVIGAAILSPSFRSVDNIVILLKQAVVPGIIAIAQTMLIISGGIDLSVGSLLTLISLVTAGIMQGRNDLIIPMVLLGLGIAVATGLVNGFLATKLRVPPFIATLGMYSILQGIALAYTTVPLGGVAEPMSGALYYGQLGPIPYPVLYFFAIFALIYWVLRGTTFGRAIYAIGGNPEVARRSGLKVEQTRLIVYILCSFLVGVASLIATARMGIGDPIAGQGMELDSITAAVIGGISLFGGRGSLLGTLAGVLILGLINNVMIMLGISMFYQQLTKGIIVLVAVAIYKQRA